MADTIIENDNAPAIAPVALQAQLEAARFCTAFTAADGSSYLRFSGQNFPDLPGVYFGLRFGEKVDPQYAKSLGETISRLRPTLIPEFANGEIVSGALYYPHDKDGQRVVRTEQASIATCSAHTSVANSVATLRLTGEPLPSLPGVTVAMRFGVAMTSHEARSLALTITSLSPTLIAAFSDPDEAEDVAITIMSNAEFRISIFSYPPGDDDPEGEGYGAGPTWLSYIKAADEETARAKAETLIWVHHSQFPNDITSVGVESGPRDAVERLQAYFKSVAEAA